MQTTAQRDKTRRRALQKANRSRTRRAKLKRALERGDEDYIELLELSIPPQHLKTAQLGAMLMCVPKMGRYKVAAAMKAARVPEHSTWQTPLSARRRLAATLRERHPTIFP